MPLVSAYSWNRINLTWPVVREIAGLKSVPKLWIKICTKTGWEHCGGDALDPWRAGRGKSACYIDQCCFQPILDALILEFLLWYRACILFPLLPWGSTGRKYIIDEMNCLVTFPQIYFKLLQRVSAERKGDKSWPLALVLTSSRAVCVSKGCSSLEPKVNVELSY